MSSDYIDDLAEATVDFFDEVYQQLKQGAHKVKTMVEEPRCAIATSVEFDPQDDKPAKVTRCGQPAQYIKLNDSELTVAMCAMHAAQAK